MLISHPIIVAIRHAESLRNSLKRGGAALTEAQRAAGAASVPDWDMALSEAGIMQARLLAERIPRIVEKSEIDLKREKFTVYTSGYARTEQTAKIALESNARFVYDEQMRHDVRLRERDAGYVYDMMNEEASALFPFMERQHKLYGGDFFFRPPGGESIADVAARHAQFFSMMTHDAFQRRALIIFSHGGSMRAMRAAICGLRPQECVKLTNPENCEAWIWRAGSHDTVEVKP